MAHPDWALQFKTKGTELRHIRGKYYLYRISSKWDKERKRTRKITHEMIGRITQEDGLIPRGIRKQPSEKTLPPLSVKEYGATQFLRSIGEDIFTQLADSFPASWQQIATLAMNRLIYQAPLKNNQFLYHESFLSEVMPDLKLDKNTLTQLMDDLGSDREKIASFLEKFVTGNQQIVFDATHLFSSSNQMNKNGIGYNPDRDFRPQVNLLYMFSVDKQQPIYYRIFPGNITGVKALKLSIQESGAKNCTVIADKGFFSQDNVALLEESGLNFILPLRRDSSYISYDRLKSREYEKAFDGHFLYKDRPIFYYSLDLASGKKTILFYDAKLKLEEESTYLRRIAQQVEGYNMAGYQEKQLQFGTFCLFSNIDKLSAQELYEQYKHRMEIETLFDSYKNLLEADSSYMHSDAGLEAWTFINHLAVMLYYKAFLLLKEHHKLASLSVRDLLLRLARVSKVKVRGQWRSAEINTKSMKLFDSLHITVT